MMNAAAALSGSARSASVVVKSGQSEKDVLRVVLQTLCPQLCV